LAWEPGRKRTTKIRGSRKDLFSIEEETCNQKTSYVRLNHPNGGGERKKRWNICGRREK